MTCIICQKPIGRREALPCSACHDPYHIKCLNLDTNYFAENTQALLTTWLCQTCEGARNPNDTSMSVDEYCIEDRSVLGQTTNTTLPDSQRDTNSSESMSIENFSRILDQKLMNQKSSIIMEIKAVLQSQIKSAIDNVKQELTQTTNALSSEQTNMKEDINYLDEKISKLEEENTILKRTLHEMKETQNKSSQPTSTSYDNNDNNKKIVIYGLEEYYKEDERDLEHRIIKMFNEVMNINLIGYVEGIVRLGKHGRKRPVLLELISKRMTKYIFRNAKAFRATGIFVSEFLDGKTLQEKKNLQAKQNHINQYGRQSTSLRTNKTAHADNLTELAQTRPSTSRVSESSTSHNRRSYTSEQNTTTTRYANQRNDNSDDKKTPNPKVSGTFRK